MKQLKGCLPTVKCLFKKIYARFLFMRHISYKNVKNNPSLCTGKRI